MTKAKTQRSQAKRVQLSDSDWGKALKAADGPKVKKDEAKPLKDYNPSGLADYLGRLDAQAKAVDEKIKAAKQEFIRRKLPTIEGRMFSCHRLEATRLRFDKARVIDEMGPDWINDHSKHESYTSVTVKVKKSAVAKLFKDD